MIIQNESVIVLVLNIPVTKYYHESNLEETSSLNGYLLANIRKKIITLLADVC